LSAVKDEKAQEGAGGAPAMIDGPAWRRQWLRFT